MRWANVASIAGVFFAAAASAHDFWMQPEPYWSPPNVSIPVTLQVGHGPQRHRSQIRPGRIVRFTAVGPDGVTIDARANLHLGGATDDGRLNFQAPGTYVMALETDNRGRSALSAQRFNEYVRTEGLTRALSERERTGRMAAAASESYRRVTKALLQIGPIEAQSQSHVTRPLGLPLEIVPERNPYIDPGAGELPVRVIFDGLPLAGALIKLTQLDDDEAPHDVQRTDQSGRATFRLPGTGGWLLNVVWTQPASAAAEVDFDTTFSSLSFGFPTRLP